MSQSRKVAIMALSKLAAGHGRPKRTKVRLTNPVETGRSSSGAPARAGDADQAGLSCDGHGATMPSDPAVRSSQIQAYTSREHPQRDQEIHPDLEGQLTQPALHGSGLL
jgi:hypothetical protein